MIFVFGSNLSGIHGAGAAKYALEKEGAVWGQGIGLQGNSYAIPTKNHKIQTMTLDEIRPHILDFLEHAKANPQNVYMLTPIGCGLAGHSRQDIAQILFDAYVPRNVVLSREWLRDYD